jgi:hypothetical protein
LLIAGSASSIGSAESSSIIAGARFKIFVPPTQKTPPFRGGAKA